MTGAVTPNQTAGPITATGQSIALDVKGYGTATIQVTGTYTAVGGLTPQITTDGTTWVTQAARSLVRMSNGVATSVIPSAAQDIWQMDVTGHNQFRIIANGTVSGTATVTILADVFASNVSVGTPTVNLAIGTPVSNSSGNIANATATATLPATAGVTNYITGFEITAAGATAGSVVTATVAGVVGGPLSYTFAAPTGALLIAQPLIVTFPTPLAATAVNTAITVSLPALGAGNTNTTTTAHGYQL